MSIPFKAPPTAEQHCSYLREEPSAGDAAGVYIAHNKSDFGTSDERVWISRRSGLPLKDEIDLSSGGPQEVTHYASRYVYDGVRARDGVKQ
jgi:outer membrane lipoprotein-sorting protein